MSHNKCMWIALFALLLSCSVRAQRPWPAAEGRVLVFYDQLSTYLSDDQCRFVAQHACGTQKVPKSFIDRLRSYNPNFLLLHYELAFGAGDIGNLEGENWVRDWPEINLHDNWFLLDCDGHRCHQTDWDWYYMDPSGAVRGAVPGWKEFWADRAVRRMRLNDCDGVFADSHNLPWNMDSYPCGFTPPDSDAALGTHFAAFDRYVMQRLHTDTTNFMYIPNIGQLITTRDVTDNSNCDGAMLENFGTYDCITPFDPADWELEMDRVLALSHLDKRLIFQTGVDYWSAVCRTWLVANYFLVKNGRSYLNLLFDWCDDGVPNWLAEYDIDLGGFVDQPPANIAALLDGASGMYIRRYSKGMVVVNASGSAHTLTMSTQRYRIVCEGGGCVGANGEFDNPVRITTQPVSSLQLDPMTAAILLYDPIGGDTTHQASDIQAFHRSGQTFITWKEAAGSDTSDRYLVYRSRQPITTVSLAGLTPIASVKPNSSFYSREADRNLTAIPAFHQTHYIITELGQPLNPGTGLLVWTPGESADAYYTVTHVSGGIENKSITIGNSLSSSVSETMQQPAPVLVWQSPNGWGRIYTQFMDLRDWNPAFEGYAYNYCVSVPRNYNREPIALTINLHGWNFRESGYEFLEGSYETPYDWQTILVATDDIYCTWHYGFSATGNPMGMPDMTAPGTGPIRNFSEERIMRVIADIVRDTGLYTIDTMRIYAYGHSMGGTGALGLGMHYGNVFAAVYCSEPMTNWTTSGAAGGADWMPDVESKWGTRTSDLTIVNRGPWSAPIRQYDGMSVWNWTNRCAMMDLLKDREMAYLVVAHGTLDHVIDFPTQAQPFYEHFASGLRAFAGSIVEADHTWLSFDGCPPNFEFGDFSFRRDEPIPAIANATSSLKTPPAGVGTFNTQIEWSSSWHEFDGPPVDTPVGCRITLRSLNGTQKADITMRRLRNFVPSPGDAITWYNIRMTGGDTLSRGTATADQYGLVTIRDFGIDTIGNRLLLGYSGAPRPRLVPGATSMDFGSVAVGSVASRTLVLFNTGDAPLTLTNQTATNAPFALFRPAASSIPAGGRDSAIVTYSPSVIGTNTGVYTASTNDPDLPSISIPLTGRCEEPQGIDRQIEPEVPVLYAPHPNPGAGPFVCAYYIPASAYVRIEVLDALGRIVAVVTNTAIPPGMYRTAFDLDGSAAGPYMVRMTATYGNHAFGAYRMIVKIR